MAERELPKLNTRVRFPSPAFARSFLAGYSAAGPALGYPVKHDPPKGRKRRAEVPPQRLEGGPTALGYPLSPARSSRATARQAPLSATPLTWPTQRRKRRAEVPPQRLEGGPTPTMHYVYILESLAVPGHFYIGSTDNLRQRLRQHQADVDAHTAKYRPWKLKNYLAFEKKATAVRFESYLKSGSGRAFCKRHFD